MDWLTGWLDQYKTFLKKTHTVLTVIKTNIQFYNYRGWIMYMFIFVLFPGSMKNSTMVIFSIPMASCGRHKEWSKY